VGRGRVSTTTGERGQEEEDGAQHWMSMRGRWKARRSSGVRTPPILIDRLLGDRLPLIGTDYFNVESTLILVKVLRNAVKNIEVPWPAS
jgi:hypothetical protein